MLGLVRREEVVRSLALTLLSVFMLLGASRAYGEEAEIACGEGRAIVHVLEYAGVGEYRTSNGLTLLLYARPGTRTVSVNVVYRAGSSDDPPDGIGTAHMVEHMMFRSAPGTGDVHRAFAQRQVKYDAATWVERTSYFSLLPSDESLAWLLSLEAARMSGIEIDEHDFERERRVVLNELQATEQDGATVLLRRALADTFGAHPYGRPVLGSRQDILHMTPAQASAFHEQYYSPHRATVVISGGFDVAKALQAACAFASIPRRGQVTAAHRNDASSDLPRVSVVSTDTIPPEAGLLVRTGPGNSKRYATANILATILLDASGGSLRSALMNRSRAISLRAFADGFAQDGYLFIYARGRTDVTAATLRGDLLEALKTIADNIEPSILNSAKRIYFERFKRATDSGEDLDIALMDAISLGDWRLFFDEAKYIEQLTPEVVSEAAQEMLRVWPAEAPRITPTVTTPLFDHDGSKQERAPPLDTTTVKSWSLVHIVRITSPPATYSGGPIFAAIPDEGAQSASISLRAECVHANPDQWSLLLPVTQRVLDVAVETPSDEQSSLQTLVSESGGTLRVAADANGITVAAQTSAGAAVPSLFALLQLADAADAVTAQAGPAIETRAMELLTSRPDPRTVGILAVQGASRGVAVASAADLLSRTGSWLRALTPADVQRNWSDCFRDRWAVALVGSSPVIGAVRSALRQRFGSPTYPPKTSKTPAGVFAHPRAVARTQLQLDGSSVGFFIARRDLAGMNEWSSNYAAYVVANYLLGGSPASRLFKALRSQSGSSYSVASFLAPDAMHHAVVFGIYATFDQSAREAFEQQVRTALQEITREGFTREEVDMATKAILREREASLSSDILVAASIAGVLASGRAVPDLLGVERRIASVDTASVNRAAKTLLEEPGLSIVLAGDFRAIEPDQRTQAGPTR